MKIKFKDFYLFSVPVNFDLAWLKILFSNHLIVRLKSQGKEGIGEGVLYKVSPFKALSLLKKEFKEFFQQDFTDLFEARKKLFQTFSFCPGIACAFDLALWDLQAKLEKKPLFRLFGKEKKNFIPVAEQIFIPRKQKMLIKEVKRIISHRTNLIKLKAGRNLKKDLENIRIINQLSKNKINIQLDLNQALDINQAINFGSKLKKEKVTAWEEPIKFDHFNKLNKLKTKVNLPLILDESIKTMKDLKRAIQYKVIDILNVKLSRLGGLTNSLRLIKECQKHKIKIDIGCSEELGIGTSAQLHLAAVLNNLIIVEALGPQRLGFDLITQDYKIKDGKLKILRGKEGLGIKFDLKRLKQASQKLNFIILSKTSRYYNDLNFYSSYLRLRAKNKFLNGLLLIKRILSNYV